VNQKRDLMVTLRFVPLRKKSTAQGGTCAADKFQNKLFSKKENSCFLR
jgi:hypothetical protein